MWRSTQSAIFREGFVGRVDDEDGSLEQRLRAQLFRPRREIAARAGQIWWCAALVQEPARALGEGARDQRQRRCSVAAIFLQLARASDRQRQIPRIYRALDGDAQAALGIFAITERAEHPGRN